MESTESDLTPGLARSKIRFGLFPKIVAVMLIISLVGFSIKNEIGDPVGDAMVYFDDRLHVTDAEGELRVEGVTDRTTIPVKIYGPGFGKWEGSFTTDRERVVITVPGGGVIEQQVLSARRFSAEDVVVRWQGYHPNGREGQSGEGEWDAEHGIARATGLETGTYALKIRLPGSATLTSEMVDVAPGEEVALAPVVPDRGLAIAGRVLDADTLQPVVGARVSCEPGSPSVFREPHLVENAPGTSTDTDGVFLLEGLDHVRRLGPLAAVARLDDPSVERCSETDQGVAVLGAVGLGQVAVEGGAVDLEERPLGPLRLSVYGLSEEVLSRSAFAVDENGRGFGGDLIDQFKDPFHRFGIADDIINTSFFLLSFLKSSVLIDQLLFFNGSLDDQF